jgi:TetR/AcrR family transcriptional regulator
LEQALATNPLVDLPSSREKILDVAEQLFSRRGYAGVGLREVADGVGLGKSSLFHHFRSKDQLYAELLGRVLRRLRNQLRPIVTAELAPAEKLVRWIEALVDALAEQPASARLLVRELVEDGQFQSEELPEAVEANQVLSEILGGIRQLLAEGIEQGVFRQVSIPHTVQTLIGATVYHFASGEFGDGLLGRSLFSAEAVETRKQELIATLQHGWMA